MEGGSTSTHPQHAVLPGPEEQICTTFTHPRTVKEVFKDFKSRRVGILKALTSEVEEFILQCDSEKENLCLYSFPDETWEVSIPWEIVPPELPEPVVGINFAKKGLSRQDWLSLVAKHSDVWLLAVSYFYGAARFDQNGRKHIFDMIHELPTVFDVVTGKKPVKDKSRVKNSGGNKAKSTRSRMQLASAVQAKPSKPPPPPAKEKEEPRVEEDAERSDIFCGSCGGIHTANGFWIGCDDCQKWFHGICVKITPARAEHIEHYKCPSCSNKRTPL